MSIRIMSQVWDLQTDSLTQKLILLALADNANDAGVCWPSISCLAKKTQMSEQSVRNQIRAITANGWMSSKARFDDAGDRASNLYQLHVPEPTKRHVGGGQLGLPPVVNGVEDGGQRPAPGVVNHVEGNHQYEPSLNHQGGEPPVLKDGKKLKFPSEALKALPIIKSDIEEIKESGSNSKWRDQFGALLPDAKEELKRLRTLLAKNKAIACE